MMRLFSSGANSPLRAFSRGPGLQAVRLSSMTAMQIHQCRRNLNLGGYALRRSARRDLNPRPSAWEADTLPLSYSRPPLTVGNSTDDTQIQHVCQPSHVRMLGTAFLTPASKGRQKSCARARAAASTLGAPNTPETTA